jgi:hypothetical protein
MKENKGLPIWAAVVAVTIVVGFVVTMFSKSGTGDASKDELSAIRANQRSFSSAAGAPPKTAQR